MRYFVEVYALGVPARRYEVSVGRGCVGTGSDDIVKLPDATGAAAGELVLQVSTEGVELALSETSQHLELLVAGKACSRAELAWSDEAFLGSTRFCFIREEQASRAVSPILPIAGLLLLFIVAALALGAAPPRNTLSEAEPPSILSGEVVCSRSAAEPAATYGEMLIERARAKAERYPYSRADGVDAYALYREGVRCLAAAQTPAESEQLEAEMEAWGQYLNTEYENLRLRLEIALRKQRPADALSATLALEEMLRASDATPHDDYWKWLQSTKKRLQLQVSSAK